MNISMPVPQTKDVVKFKKIMRDLHGVELSDQEAYNQCANMVQYVYLTYYALPALRKFQQSKDEGKKQ